MSLRRQKFPIATARASLATGPSLAVAVLTALTALAPRAAAQTVDLRAVGDSAFVGGNAQFAAPPDGWVAQNLKALEPLRSPDVNFLNLEAALTRSCRDFFQKEFMFAVAPEALIQFGQWGFNLVGLANNHGQDCIDPHHSKAVEQTFAQVRDALPNLGMHGVAPTAAELTTKPAIITVNGVRIGMVAIKGWEGGKAATIGNLDNRHAIFRALQDADVDVRVLSLHGGVESSRHPADVIVAVAREFVGRYGGDLVLAHHPHVMQGFELLKKSDGRYAAIYFSLGNHLHNGLSDKGDGLMAKVTLTKAGVDPDEVYAFPLSASNTRPGPLDKSELPRVTSMLRSSSTSVAAKPMPSGLSRVAFTLEPTYAPAPGVHLVSTKVTVPAKRTKASRRESGMPAGWVPPQIPPAKWIPPDRSEGDVSTR